MVLAPDRCMPAAWFNLFRPRLSLLPSFLLVMNQLIQIYSPLPPYPSPKLKPAQSPASLDLIWLPDRETRIGFGGRIKCIQSPEGDRVLLWKMSFLVIPAFVTLRLKTSVHTEYRQTMGNSHTTKHNADDAADHGVDDQHQSVEQADQSDDSAQEIP